MTRLSEAEATLAPASAKAGNAELAACLTLVASSGMTAADRNEWIKVAAATLTGMPLDLLQRGCKVARERCRFPSEIVPMILDEVRLGWNMREDRRADLQRQLNPRPRLVLEAPPEPTYVEAQEIRKLIRSLGSRT